MPVGVARVERGHRARARDDNSRPHKLHKRSLCAPPALARRRYPCSHPHPHPPFPRRSDDNNNGHSAFADGSAASRGPAPRGAGERPFKEADESEDGRGGGGRATSGEASELPAARTPGAAPLPPAPTSVGSPAALDGSLEPGSWAVSPPAAPEDASRGSELEQAAPRTAPEGRAEACSSPTPALSRGGARSPSDDAGRGARLETASRPPSCVPAPSAPGALAPEATAGRLAGSAPAGAPGLAGGHRVASSLSLGSSSLPLPPSGAAHGSLPRFPSLPPARATSLLHTGSDLSASLASPSSAQHLFAPDFGGSTAALARMCSGFGGSSAALARLGSDGQMGSMINLCGRLESDGISGGAGWAAGAATRAGSIDLGFCLSDAPIPGAPTSGSPQEPSAPVPSGARPARQSAFTPLQAASPRQDNAQWAFCSTQAGDDALADPPGSDAARQPHPPASGGCGSPDLATAAPAGARSASASPSPPPSSLRTLEEVAAAIGLGCRPAPLPPPSFPATSLPLARRPSRRLSNKLAGPLSGGFLPLVLEENADAVRQGERGADGRALGAAGGRRSARELGAVSPSWAGELPAERQQLLSLSPAPLSSAPPSPAQISPAQTALSHRDGPSTAHTTIAGPGTCAAPPVLRGPEAQAERGAGAARWAEQDGPRELSALPLSPVPVPSPVGPPLAGNPAPAVQPPPAPAPQRPPSACGPVPFGPGCVPSKAAAQHPPRAMNEPAFPPLAAYAPLPVMDAPTSGATQFSTHVAQARSSPVEELCAPAQVPPGLPPPPAALAPALCGPELAPPVANFPAPEAASNLESRPRAWSASDCAVAALGGGSTTVTLSGGPATSGSTSSRPGPTPSGPPGAEPLPARRLAAELPAGPAAPVTPPQTHLWVPLEGGKPVGPPQISRVLDATVDVTASWKGGWGANASAPLGQGCGVDPSLRAAPWLSGAGGSGELPDRNDSCRTVECWGWNGDLGAVATGGGRGASPAPAPAPAQAGRGASPAPAPAQAQARAYGVPAFAPLGRRPSQGALPLPTQRRSSGSASQGPAPPASRAARAAPTPPSSRGGRGLSLATIVTKTGAVLKAVVLPSRVMGFGEKDTLARSDEAGQAAPARAGLGAGPPADFRDAWSGPLDAPVARLTAADGPFGTSDPSAWPRPPTPQSVGPASLARPPTHAGATAAPAPPRAWAPVDESSRRTPPGYRSSPSPAAVSDSAAVSAAWGGRDSGHNSTELASGRRAEAALRPLRAEPPTPTSPPQPSGAALGAPWSVRTGAPGAQGGSAVGDDGARKGGSAAGVGGPVAGVGGGFSVAPTVQWWGERPGAGIAQGYPRHPQEAAWRPQGDVRDVVAFAFGAPPPAFLGRGPPPPPPSSPPTTAFPRPPPFPPPPQRSHGSSPGFFGGLPDCLPVGPPTAVGPTPAPRAPFVGPSPIGWESGALDAAFREQGGPAGTLREAEAACRRRDGDALRPSSGEASAASALPPASPSCRQQTTQQLPALVLGRGFDGIDAAAFSPRFAPPHAPPAIAPPPRCAPFGPAPGEGSPPIPQVPSAARASLPLSCPPGRTRSLPAVESRTASALVGAGPSGAQLASAGGSASSVGADPNDARDSKRFRIGSGAANELVGSYLRWQYQQSGVQAAAEQGGETGAAPRRGGVAGRQNASLLTVGGALASSGQRDPISGGRLAKAIAEAAVEALARGQAGGADKRKRSPEGPWGRSGEGAELAAAGLVIDEARGAAGGYASAGVSMGTAASLARSSPRTPLASASSTPAHRDASLCLDPFAQSLGVAVRDADFPARAGGPTAEGGSFARAALLGARSQPRPPTPPSPGRYAPRPPSPLTREIEARVDELLRPTVGGAGGRRRRGQSAPRAHEPHAACLQALRASMVEMLLADESLRGLSDVELRKIARRERNKLSAKLSRQQILDRQRRLEEELAELQREEAALQRTLREAIVAKMGCGREQTTREEEEEEATAAAVAAEDVEARGPSPPAAPNSSRGSWVAAERFPGGPGSFGAPTPASFDLSTGSFAPGKGQGGTGRERPGVLRGAATGGAFSPQANGAAVGPAVGRRAASPPLGASAASPCSSSIPGHSSPFPARPIVPQAVPTPPRGEAIGASWVSRRPSGLFSDPLRGELELDWTASSRAPAPGAPRGASDEAAASDPLSLFPPFPAPLHSSLAAATSAVAAGAAAAIDGAARLASAALGTSFGLCEDATGPGARGRAWNVPDAVSRGGEQAWGVLDTAGHPAPGSTGVGSSRPKPEVVLRPAPHAFGDAFACQACPLGRPQAAVCDSDPRSLPAGASPACAVASGADSEPAPSLGRRFSDDPSSCQTGFGGVRQASSPRHTAAVFATFPPQLGGLLASQSTPGLQSRPMGCEPDAVCQKHRAFRGGAELAPSFA